jgi:hypothetical protein
MKASTLDMARVIDEVLSYCERSQEKLVEMAKNQLGDDHPTLDSFRKNLVEIRNVRASVRDEKPLEAKDYLLVSRSLLYVQWVKLPLTVKTDDGDTLKPW